MIDQGLITGFTRKFYVVNIASNTKFGKKMRLQALMQSGGRIIALNGRPLGIIQIHAQ